MRETIIKAGIVFILVLLAVGAVSGIARLYTPPQRSNHRMAIRYYIHNPGNHHANHFAAKPVTLSQIYCRTPQM
ncbi:MAG: hypothetical protein N2V76_06610 [Methanophagales archaeon]|nr:hypothetical protein [Methanophagales archaeon]